MHWQKVLFIGALTLLIAVGVAAHFGKQPEKGVILKPLQNAEHQVPPPSTLVRRPLTGVQLLETGEGFHGTEIKARNGEKWLGLFVMESGSKLMESTIKIQFVNDPIMDEDELSATGKSVSVEHPTEPLLLIKNVPGLKPGPVTTIFYAKPDEFFSLYTHSPVSLKLGTQSYQLKLIGTGPGVDSILPRDPQLLLTDGVITQVLCSLEGEVSDIDWDLKWAGDLDGDGKLDLYADLNSHYNMTARKLFLSSQAKPGQLVAEVAKFMTTGC
ncbi:MAG: hypothetical protein HYR56_01160 [Acidobacteria bacterium]|nr:hypothetical protein [Acidobacteriota bacterium]MBI3426900.1 hypothetical protein [Acidobacteriota bacterium]